MQTIFAFVQHLSKQKKINLIINTFSRIYTTSVLFLARGVISGLFQAAYIYTPDIYPNNLRSLGVGGCSTIARLGAMATPFVSQVLFQSSASSAFMVYTSIGLLSAVACIILPESQILIWMYHIYMYFIYRKITLLDFFIFVNKETINLN